MVVDRRWRALAATATTTALLLSAAVPSVAQEGDDGPTEAALVCEGGEVLDDTDGEPFLLVEPGATVTCTAEGLDESLTAQLTVEIFGFTDEDDFDLDEEDDAPTEVIEQTLDAGVDTFSFAVPSDVLFGFFDGVLEQEGETEDEPSYQAFFGGLISGEFLAGMDCAPDPVEVGSEVTCEVEEFAAGEFDWEVYLLTVDELIEAVFGDGGPDAPDASGTGQADETGIGTFTFTAGDAELYLAIADQDASFAFYAGEIEPAADSGGSPAPAPAPQPQPPAEQVEDDDPQAAPVAPRRVDAGEGPVGPSPASLLALAALAGLFGVSAQRVLSRR